MVDAMYMDNAGSKLESIGQSINNFFTGIRDRVVDFWTEHEIEEKLKAFWESVAKFGKDTLEKIGKGLGIIGGAIKNFAIAVYNATTTLGQNTIKGLGKICEFVKTQAGNFATFCKDSFKKIKEIMGEKLKDARNFFNKDKSKEDTDAFTDETKSFMATLGEHVKNFMEKAGSMLKTIARKTKKAFKIACSKEGIEPKDFKEAVSNFFSNAKTKFVAGVALVGGAVAGFYKKTKQKVANNVKDFKDFMAEAKEAREIVKNEKLAIRAEIAEDLEYFVETSKEEDFNTIRKVMDVDAFKDALEKILPAFGEEKLKYSLKDFIKGEEVLSLDDLEEEIEAVSLQEIIENKKIAKKYKKEVAVLKENVDKVVNFIKDESIPAEARQDVQDIFEICEIPIGYGVDAGEYEIMENIEDVISDYAFADAQPKTMTQSASQAIDKTYDLSRSGAIDAAKDFAKDEAIDAVDDMVVAGAIDDAKAQVLEGVASDAIAIAKEKEAALESVVALAKADAVATEKVDSDVNYEIIDEEENEVNANISIAITIATACFNVNAEEVNAITEMVTVGATTTTETVEQEIEM